MPHALPPKSAAPRSSRSVWLGVVVGWLAQLGLSTFLPIVAVVAGRTWAVAVGAEDSWAEHTLRSNQAGWLVVQAVTLLGSVVAGAVGAAVALRKSWVLPVALVLLSLASTFFQQLPRPMSPVAVALWGAGPCVGLLVGVALVWLARRRDA
jgi:hypothetical protein